MILNKNLSQGKIEVICGSMFSGKTEELIIRIVEAKLNRLRIIVFKPTKDSRNPNDKIVSRSKAKIKAKSIGNSKEILSKKYSNFDVIGIDEAQFFDMDLVDVCNSIANQGKRVIVSGLDMDYSGKPFGPMPFLMACADEITKLHAICSETGGMANYSYRKKENNQQFLIGENDDYEALSRSAFINKMKKRK